MALSPCRSVAPTRPRPQSGAMPGNAPASPRPWVPNPGLKWPKNAHFASLPTPGVHQRGRRAKCAQAPGVRAGPSRGPQCSGQHSFRSLDAFSLGIAVHRRYRFRARTIVRPPQTRRAVLQAPLSCRAPTPLASFCRLAWGAEPCGVPPIRASPLGGCGARPRPRPHHSLALPAAVQEPRLGTLCTSAFWEVRWLRERAVGG